METAFVDYARDPSPERLAALLTAAQDRVYNICYQILRRPPDAEDACQEVLIEIARGARSIGAPRPFKVWLYRVAVHTALDRKESIARQARLAKAAPPPEGPPMNDADRAELMRAIGRLDDRSRLMILEHYFDKATLEEIAAREGVSAVAVWKRLERARETLRRGLAGVAFLPLLESLVPVSAPSGLVAKAVMAGGAVVGMKSAVAGGTIVAAIVLIGVASTGGYLVGAGRAERPPREITRIEPAAPSIELPSPAVDTPKPVEPKATPAVPPEKAGRADQAIGVEDPARVFFGRPDKPEVEDLVTVESWDEFYARAKEKKLSPNGMEDLIFRRLGRELNLEAKTMDELQKLFDREREETTRVIVDHTGGPSGFDRKIDEAMMNWAETQEEWRRLREGVRKTFTEDYLRLLSRDQLALLCDHLRNGVISLESSYATEGSYFLVGGVGKPTE